MDSKILATVFFTVFVAEPGDKTRLATMLFAGDKAVSKRIAFACAGFIAIGIWTLVRA